MSRSLKVDPKYIQKVNLALKRNGYPSQRKFAEDIVPSLSTVKNFLKGKPVDYENFREICDRLELDWQAITYIDVDVEPDEEVAKPNQEIEESEASSIEERIFKATDQLNPERLVFSRISGIQALGEIAKDSPRYHWKIMELLAAFVRENAPRKGEEEGEEERSPKLPDDIQAAFTVIGRRDTNKDPENQRLDLSKVNIAGAELMKAQLQGAFLYEANLQEANLIDANLQKANLRGTNLKGAWLHETNLQKAYLNEANLQEAELSSTDLQGASLNKANLRGADLRVAKLQGANLSEADLQGTNLSSTDLQGADLSEANLQGTDLSTAKVQGAFFYKANLQGANIGGDRNLTRQQIESANVDHITRFLYDLETPEE